LTDIARKIVGVEPDHNPATPYYAAILLNASITFL